MKKFLLVLFCSALICGSAEASANKQISLNVEVRVIDNEPGMPSHNENIEALKIVTSSKIYTVVKPTTKWKHNRKKYREVFDSGVRFVITSNLFTAPTSVKTWADLYNTLKNIPQKDIKKGSVRLAGRIGDKWGGMIIKKD